MSSEERRPDTTPVNDGVETSAFAAQPKKQKRTPTRITKIPSAARKAERTIALAGNHLEAAVAALMVGDKAGAAKAYRSAGQALVIAECLLRLGAIAVEGGGAE